MPPRPAHAIHHFPCRARPTAGQALGSPPPDVRAGRGLHDPRCGAFPFFDARPERGALVGGADFAGPPARAARAPRLAPGAQTPVDPAPAAAVVAPGLRTGPTFRVSARE